ncbi:hypothetical protein AVEN_29347-1 [Araneus ventricosus]|uniref:Uncharacterized protein n=1 Tax=Araneus ventricosus TaxID=182803 RepID=A0A4Y2J0A0_ARAVE|nr:hypothetical protein AVEN_29347-1 [Araneus ventricosus]
MEGLSPRERQEGKEIGPKSIAIIRCAPPSRPDLWAPIDSLNGFIGPQGNVTCGDPTILPYELIRSRNRGTVGHSVRLPREWQVLDVYASRLITLTAPEYGALCQTLLSVHLFHPAINL